MVSDLSNIFKDELSNTLEQLLSKSSQVETIVSLSDDSFDSMQFVECSVKFDLKGLSTIVNFLYTNSNSNKI